MIMNESLADFESTGDLQTDTEILAIYSQPE